MIYYDSTKMGGKAPRSGLTRLSGRLQQELAGRVATVAWDARRRGWVDAARRRPVDLNGDDWLLTAELFSEAERPGIREFTAKRPCRLAAMFHDAIPLRFPHITWPHSVRRHPDYLKMLAGFDRVFAISEASRRDLTEFWRWQGVEARAEVAAVVLGADFDGAPRATSPQPATGRSSLLCVGIIEPRKNQVFLLGVAEALWRQGTDFDLQVVGRVNPHFGPPIAKQMRALQRREPRFHCHAAAPDRVLQKLYADARAVVFPTMAEGCGLPLLEALWRGAPCVCSDLPVLRENSAGGGCLAAKTGHAGDWQEKLRAVLTDAALHARLRQEALTRPLPRWADTATAILAALK